MISGRLTAKLSFSIKKVEFLYMNKKTWFFSFLIEIIRFLYQKVRFFDQNSRFFARKTRSFYGNTRFFKNMLQMASIYLGNPLLISKKGFLELFALVYICLHLSILVYTRLVTCLYF